MKHFLRYHKTSTLTTLPLTFQPLLPITNVEEAIIIMLPYQIYTLITKLTDSIYFDVRLEWEFDKIKKKHLAKFLNATYVTSYNETFLDICNDAALFIEKRARFIHDTIQEVISTSEIDDINFLDEDLKEIFNHAFGIANGTMIFHLELLRKELKVEERVFADTHTRLTFIPTKVGAEVQLISHKYKHMKNKQSDKSTGHQINIHAPANIQIGDNNSQQIYNSIQKIEQAIDKSDKPAEQKTKAKGMLHAALAFGGVMYEKTVAGITEGIMKQ